MTHQIRHFINQNRKVIGVYILNIFIFLLFFVFYFTLLAFKGEAVRLLFLNQNTNFFSQFFYSLSPGYIAFVVLLFQITFITVINRKYLQTRKQVVMVNILVFITFLAVIATQLIPINFKIKYCSTIIRSKGEEAGKCMTFIENSRVVAVYFMAIYYLFLYVMNATGLQLLLFSTRNKWQIASFSLLFLVVTGAVLILPFLKYRFNQNTIQVKPFPKESTPLYRLELNNNPQIDPKIHQLKPALNLQNPAYGLIQ